MEWLNTPNTPQPKDICPVYACIKRSSDNDGPCVLYLCGCKFCICNY